MKMRIGISVIVPAYNEEGNIRNTVIGISDHLKKLVNDFEIIVVNDGSTDKTSQIIRKLIKNNYRIKLIDRKVNLGFGYTISEGIQTAKKEYITQFHGDNDASLSVLDGLIKNYNSGDIVTNYPAVTVARPLYRRVLSKLFVILMNYLFGLNLIYYNGVFLSRTRLIKSLHPTSKGFAIYAEIKVRLFNKGYTISQIPFKYVGRKNGKSKSFTMTSFLNTIETVTKLINDIYMKKLLMHVKSKG
jgi:dolichol-phosphate mannosyltransferase